MERSEDDQIAFTWRQFYSEDQDIPEQLNYFAMVKVRKRAMIKLYATQKYGRKQRVTPLPETVVKNTIATLQNVQTWVFVHFEFGVCLHSCRVLPKVWPRYRNLHHSNLTSLTSHVLVFWEVRRSVSFVSASFYSKVGSHDTLTTLMQSPEICKKIDRNSLTDFFWNTIDFIVVPNIIVFI